MIYLILAAAIFLRTVTDISFKMAVHKLNFDSIHSVIPNFKKVVLSPYIWLGGLVAVMNLGLWCVSLIHFDLSFAYPLFSISYITVILAGRVIFKEHLDRNKMIGIGFIILGVVTLTFF